jgi:L-lactate dehydrogenase complex protein LldG
MEKEKLVTRAEAAGVQVHWTTPKTLSKDVRSFLNGRTIFCGPDLGIAFDAPSQIPAQAGAGIARAHRWAQETATALVSGEDQAALLPPVSVLLVDEKNIVPSYDDLIDFIRRRPDRWFAAVTGPSRTADIEKVLVIPAHGPKELHLFIVES